MKKYFAVLVFCLICFNAYPSTFRFVPIVRNYTAADYLGGRQNWSLSQDSQGLIYVGNNSTLLEFDNNVWKHHSMPDRDLVREVYVAEDGRIYCGAYEEFGYFERSGDGLEYHSLSSSFDISQIRNAEIWNIVDCSGYIVFQSFNSLFIYDGNEVRMLGDIKPLNIFSIGGNLYVQMVNGDFVCFPPDLEEVDEETIISRDKGIGDVVAAMPFKGGLLLMTSSHGGYLYKDGNLSRWETEIDEVLKMVQVNRAVATRDGSYIIGTISDGIYSLDAEGRFEWSLDMSQGMQNNTVLGLLCDDDDNIWVALDDGISYIDRSSGIYVYRPQNHAVGMVYDILFDDERTYLATNQGLYLSEDDQLARVPGMEGQTWFAEKVGGKVYVGHNQGLFRLDGMNAKLVSNVGGGTFCMRTIQNRNETLVLTGTYAVPGIYRIRPWWGGEWEYIPVLKDISQIIKNLEYDGHGNIWCEHFKSGLVRLAMNPDLTTLEEETVYRELGGVRDTVFNVMKIKGRVVFSNGRKFYTYDDLAEDIIPYDAMNEGLGEVKGVHQAEQASESYYWLVSDRDLTLIDCRRDRFQVVMTIPYSYFGSPIEERSSVVYDPHSHDSYLLLSNQVVRIDMDKLFYADTDSTRELSLLELAASDRQGNTVRIPLTPNVRIRNQYNSIKFRLRYPVYNERGHVYRYMLEGLNDSWIVSDHIQEQQFYRLSSGRYRFVAEVISGDRCVASTSFDFIISRPWYLSWWMMCIYVASLVILLLVVNTVVMYRMRKENARRLEEQEKLLLEQRELQLEKELRDKSKDLAGMSMTVIAHNEVLDSILKEIQDQRGKPSRQSLDKIQRIIKSSLISNQEQWDMFQQNFDRVHENFFRRLKEEYPDLTSTDLRLCALLRLNLSTKDIANMLNLTVRGVESARYRLRKRLDIPAEASLVDFMINFK